MNDQLLNKIVTQYCDPTVPSEIIKETVEEIKVLHDEGKILFSESAIYDFVHQIKRDKTGKIVECGGIETVPEEEMTEPEEFEAIDCLEGGIFNSEEEVLE